MQSSINGDCQEERLKEHPSSTGNVGADGRDGSESLTRGKMTLMSALSGFS